MKAEHFNQRLGEEMNKFKITFLIDGDITCWEREFLDSQGISAREWADDYAREIADDQTGWYELEEMLRA